MGMEPKKTGIAEPISRLDEIEAELWVAVNVAKKGKQVSALTGLLDQLRKVQNDKVKLLREELREAKEEVEEWPDLLQRIISALENFPAAKEAVRAALDDGDLN
jgi:hypothetical protein